MSPHAHARIKSIDTSKAAAADGVLCVLTGQDAAADGIGHAVRSDAGGHGRTEGLSRVCGRCWRPTRCAQSATASHSSWRRAAAQAQNAAELIEVDYEMLPAVTTIEEAVKPGAPAVWDDNPGNVAFALDCRQQGRDRRSLRQGHAHGVAAAESNRVSANAIEPRAAIGDYNPAEATATRSTRRRRTRTATARSSPATSSRFRRPGCA